MISISISIACCATCAHLATNGMCCNVGSAFFGEDMKADDHCTCYTEKKKGEVTNGVKD